MIIGTILNMWVQALQPAKTVESNTVRLEPGVDPIVDSIRQTFIDQGIDPDQVELYLTSTELGRDAPSLTITFQYDYRHDDRGYR